MYHTNRIGLVLALILAMSFFAGAQSESELLEKGIYTEETLGNLDEAIEIYQQIVADTDASRPTAALALYRLGICYQRSGQLEQAQASFDKLTKLYPEQKDLISKIPVPSVSDLLQPATWTDGEFLQIKWTLKNANESFFIWSIHESIQEGGKKLWKFDEISYLYRNSGTFKSTVVDSQNFLPIRSKTRYMGTGTEIQTKYTDSQVEISTLQNNAFVRRQIPIDRPVYGAGYEFFVRSLPLSEGFSITIPFVPAGNETVTSWKIEVTGRETVTAPVGTFDCYKVLVSNRSRELYTFWLSADGHLYPIKVQGRVSEGLLNSITTLNKNQPAVFDDRKIGVQLSAPAGWQILESNYPANYQGNSEVFIVGPEGEAYGCLQITPISEHGRLRITSNSELATENASPATALDMWIKDQEEYFKDFAIRPEGPDYTPICGMTAARVIADLKSPNLGNDIVRYITVFMNETKACIARFTTAKASFDDMKPVLDSILNSIEMD